MKYFIQLKVVVLALSIAACGSEEEDCVDENGNPVEVMCLTEDCPNTTDEATVETPAETTAKTTVETTEAVIQTTSGTSTVTVQTGTNDDGNTEVVIVVEEEEVVEVHTPLYDDADAMTAGTATTLSGKEVEYVFANGVDGFKIWAEVGGTRVIRADGADEWAKNLNINGRGRSADDFADADIGTAATVIEGRVCPDNVYIDDTNKFDENSCLYYTKSFAPQHLAVAGNTQDTAGSIGINNYTVEEWYTGNIELCSSKGMRLPTLFETSVLEVNVTNTPTTDGTPIFAEEKGVPSSVTTFTATTSSNANFTYQSWSGEDNFGNDWYVNLAIRCVLP